MPCFMELCTKENRPMHFQQDAGRVFTHGTGKQGHAVKSSTWVTEAGTGGNEFALAMLSSTATTVQCLSVKGVVYVENSTVWGVVIALGSRSRQLGSSIRSIFFRPV